MKRLELFTNTSALVLVDWQERLFAAMEEKTARRNLRNALNLIEGCRLLGVPLLATEQYPKGLGPTLEAIRQAAPDLEPIEKIDFDGCAVARFEKRLAELGRGSVILTGMETHICVYQTARGLAALDYDVHVPVDAVISRTKSNWRVGLNLLQQSGAILTSSEAVLFDLLKRAEGETFKAVSKLVR